MTCRCISECSRSIANGYGRYEGLFQVMNKILTVALPCRVSVEAMLPHLQRRFFYKMKNYSVMCRRLDNSLVSLCSFSKQASLQFRFCFVHMRRGSCKHLTVLWANKHGLIPGFLYLNNSPIKCTIRDRSFITVRPLHFKPLKGLNFPNFFPRGSMPPDTPS